MDSRAVLLLAVVVCAGLAAGQIVHDCCLETKDKQVPRRIAASYIIQEAGKGCSISATVFVTRRGKTICAPAASERPWVQELVAYLDEKSKRRQ